MWQSGTILLDDRRTGAAGGLLFDSPERLIVARTGAECAAALAAAEAALAAGRWLAGYLAYELGHWLEPRLRPLLAGTGAPLVLLGVYDAPRRLDRAGVAALLAASGEGEMDAPVPRFDETRYAAAFERIAALIAAGDVYQVNLTFPADFTATGDVVGLYRSLAARQPVSHGAMVVAEDHAVVSLSPELFVARRGDRLTTRPMKGTAPRGRTTAEDVAAAGRLRADPKSRAENLMIVDLLRNDLSRICRSGSVSVPELFAVETYPSLLQMTSTVTGEIVPGTGLGEILAALFPCGSVTGAPKIRAMEIIAEVEAGPRGVYTGAIGWFAPGGDFELSVAIRTAVVGADGRGTIGIGGGIVADSVLADEYREALLKMAFLDAAEAPVGLIETLLWERGPGYALLARHLDRLVDSAQYFGLPVTRAAAQTALERAAEGFAADRMRVRLEASPEGGLEITSAPLPADPDPRFRFAVAPERMESGNRHLFHKTTRRSIYDEPRRRAAARVGADEVIFLNERGEITEGSFTSVFLRRDGRLLTPALDCGLLPGTLRAELLARGEAEEAVLTPADLASAEAIFLGNSVRGLVPAHWIEKEAR